MNSDLSIASSAEHALASGQLGLAVGLALVGGFLTALSPCVYPLIPITLSVFGARETKSRGHAFSLALAYTLGMVLLYAVLGTAFASAGKVFGTLLANRWVVLGFALFCALMAASMLGFFELRLPTVLQTRLATVGGKGHQGAFTMGLASGLVAAPCTGPVLSVLLTFIAQTNNVRFGFALMLGFGFGLGLPFLALATFSQSIKKLPKSGAWMEGVKAILGVMMIALALYYLQFALPALVAPLKPWWLPWLLIALGVLNGGIHLSIHSPSPWVKIAKVAGAMVIGIGIFSVFLAREPHHDLRWVTNETSGLAAARAAHEPVMIDFFATWCAACVELDEKVYSRPEVQAALARFVAIKIDGTEEGDEVQALYKKYGVKGLPTVVFIDANGTVLAEPRVTGFVPADAFMTLLAKVPR